MGKQSFTTNLELFAEGLIIKEDPGIPILAVPVVFELAHALHDARQL